MSTLQVDRIIPYQSASVTIDGLSAPNLATTGSNTFTGDQNIQGTITASIAEGFALVGGVGNVSTLVATSSFGQAIDLASLATTGSNTFVGNQIISGSTTTTGQLKVSGSANSTTITTNGFTAVNNSGGGVGGALDFGGYLAVSTADASELSLAADANTYSGNWTKGPAIVSNNPANAYPAIIGFQNKTNWTDGRPTFLTPVDFNDNINVTGSVTISGSTEFDLTVQGRQLITGPTTGETPQLLISGSDFTNQIGRGNIAISGVGSFVPNITISSSLYRSTRTARLNEIVKSGFNYPVFNAFYSNESSSFLYNFTDNLTATASYTVGVFDNGFTQDVELMLETTTTNGVQFKDIDSVSGLYTTFMRIAPNGGTNPPLEYKRALQVTGSVSVSDV